LSLVTLPSPNAEAEQTKVDSKPAPHFNPSRPNYKSSTVRRHPISKVKIQREKEKKKKRHTIGLAQIKKFSKRHKT
jgi:hypothetical protein